MKEIIKRAASIYTCDIKSKHSFIDGANFVLSSLWQEDTDDESMLPPIGKEVIVITIDGEVNTAYRVPQSYGFYPCGKAGWNIPDVKYFLNVELPKD